MKTINKERAKIICSNWHSGQWSVFYQFASSGEYLKENALLYLDEVYNSLQTDFALYPRDLKASEKKELKQLERFFNKMNLKNGIKTEIKKHNIYGYLYPVLVENVNFEIKPLIQLI